MRKINKFRIAYNKERIDYYIQPFPYPQVLADKINQMIDHIEMLERKLGLEIPPTKPKGEEK